MPGSKTTPNFNFPYYGPLDTFSPLVTYNGLAQQLDNILKTLQTKGEQNGALIAEVQDALDAVHASVDANTTLIDQINQSKNLWKEILIHQTLTATSAPGVFNAVVQISLSQYPAIMLNISGGVTLASATKTLYGDGNYYTFVEFVSFPEVLPILPVAAVDPAHATGIGNIIGKFRKNEADGTTESFQIAGYRKNNITQIGIILSTTSANENNYVYLFKTPSITYFG